MIHPVIPLTSRSIAANVLAKALAGERESSKLEGGGNVG
jgi:hypothetical protein